MFISKKVHEAVELSRSAAEFAVSEDPGRLRISGVFSRAALTAWQAVADESCPWLTLDCTDEAQDHVQPGRIVGNERVRLTVNFEQPSGACYLFTHEGWRSFLYDERFPRAVSIVKLAFITVGFATKAFAVEPWTSMPEPAKPPIQVSNAGPRRQVRCQSSSMMAPPTIEPWVLITWPPETELGFTVWSCVAAEMIARSLPNELFLDQGEAYVGLAGQPPRLIKLGAFRDRQISLDVLRDAAAWVYLEGSDVEVRHTFLSAELAREWSPDLPFCEGLIARLRGAMDSARLLYKAHLRAGSKDTLRALGDLRKGLTEDVQKLLQQSRDLSAAVWRDVAIAIGVMAVKFAVDGAKAGPSADKGFAFIYLAVAIYIVISYCISINTIRRFLEIVEEARITWRTKLYAFLDDSDYRILADQPLRAAKAAYEKTQTWTSLVVTVVILVLSLLTARELGWIQFGDLISAIYQVGVGIWDWANNLASVH